MEGTGSGQTVTVRVFGFLRHHMDEHGLSYALEKDLPGAGCTALDMAYELSIPPEKIEAVFCNGRVINIYDTILPGDRIAFFPYGTPGPYRVFLGMVRENRERTRREEVDGVEKGSEKS